MHLHEIEDLLQNRAGLSAEALEALAEYAGVGLFNLDLSTGRIALNNSITRLAGYAPGEIPHSQNSRDMLTFEDDRAMVNAAMGRLVKGEESRYSIEYRMRRKDGSIVAISESAIVYERDPAGRPVQIAGLAQDLSRLRWAEERTRALEKENRRLAKQTGESDLADQNRMLRAANTAAALIISGFHQDYETVLRQALQTLGESVLADRVYVWRNAERDGKMGCFLRAIWDKDAQVYTAPTVYPGDADATLYDDILPDWQERFFEGYSFTGEAGKMVDFHPMPDQLAGKYILLAPLYLHGEFWGLLGFDSAAREQPFNGDEAEIMVSGARVIASSISRNETFGKLNEAREAAMASTRAKSEFLSRMSHEIRTPMNAIIGMTTIAKKTDDPARVQYCLNKVDGSSRQLLSLINDVLDMSKIDSGKFEIVAGAFDFEKMIQNVFNVVEVKLEEKHQDLRVNFDEVFTRAIVSDELRLSQVLINLLGNATKFTPEGGRIVLTIQLSPLDGGRSRLHVEVKDTGIGITPEQQKRLFTSFEQADGTITRAYGGTGLGLAICKKIVGLMGGDIWVESVTGAGSNFLFEVPVEWGEKLPTASAMAGKPGKLRILVVDDAEDVREYFAGILGTFQLACDTADGGPAAIEKAKASLAEGRPYDMIFVDWNMPGMNGGATAAGLRRILGKEAVVVLISVADRADLGPGVSSADVDYFLPKPVLPSILYNTIVKLSDNTLVTEKTSNDAIDWTGRTILLAEDIEINREIILSVLDETGVQIVSAEDGEVAVERFAADPERYDLILMDVQMPRKDGLSATREIRAMDIPWAKKIPILAMTANAFKEDARLCLDAGMNDHLAKPLDVDVLLRTLSGYFDPA